MCFPEPCGGCKHFPLTCHEKKNLIISSQMLVATQPPSTQGSCPLLVLSSTSGRPASSGTGWNLPGSSISSHPHLVPHASPSMSQYSHGHPYLHLQNQGKPFFLPAAAFCSSPWRCRAPPGPAPVPESVRLWLDGQKKGEACGQFSHQN